MLNPRGLSGALSYGELFLLSKLKSDPPGNDTMIEHEVLNCNLLKLIKVVRLFRCEDVIVYIELNRMLETFETDKKGK